MEQKHHVHNRLTLKITSFSINKDALYKFFKILQERINAAFEIEEKFYKKLIKQNDKTDEENEEYKKIKILKEGFELRPTITSIDGQELYGSIENIFNNANFPDQIKSIYLNSELFLKTGFNYYPRNLIKLFFDFSKPDLFNLSLLPSQETPNESKIEVTGYDSTWVNGVFKELSDFINKNPSKLTLLHKHSIYDLLLWILGLPFGFWMSYKFSNKLNKIFGFSIFVQSASYVYVFFASLFVFRLIFHYARWIWPMVEYKNNKNKALKHRLFLSAIAFSLFTYFIYDFIKLIMYG